MPRASARLAGRAAPLGWGVAGAAATAVVALVDPHVPGRYPGCPLLALTGLSCPLCGALRATHDLAHLDVAGALAANPWWVVTACGLVAGWVLWLARPAWILERVPPRLVVGVPAAAAVVFGVARNVPALAGVLGPGG